MNASATSFRDGAIGPDHFRPVRTLHKRDERFDGDGSVGLHYQEHLLHQAIGSIGYVCLGRSGSVERQRFDLAPALLGDCRGGHADCAGSSGELPGHVAAALHDFHHRHLQSLEAGNPIAGDLGIDFAGRARAGGDGKIVAAGFLPVDEFARIDRTDLRLRKVRDRHT